MMLTLISKTTCILFSELPYSPFITKQASFDVPSCGRSVIYYMIVSGLFQEEVILYNPWKEKSMSSAEFLYFWAQGQFWFIQRENENSSFM